MGFQKSFQMQRHCDDYFSKTEHHRDTIPQISVLFALDLPFALDLFRKNKSTTNKTDTSIEKDRGVRCD